MSEATGLVRYDEMCKAIADCVQVDEAAEIRAKARAMEVYAKQAMNTDAERQACSIRLRAEDKAGQLLAKKERGQGRRNDKLSPANGGSSEYAETLERLGIPQQTANRWEQLAAVPDDIFEEALADPDKMPSTNGILKRAKGAPKMDDDALWIWGRLRDFEKMALYDKVPCELLAGMTETMQADCRRIAPILSMWLQEFDDG